MERPHHPGSRRTSGDSKADILARDAAGGLRLCRGNGTRGVTAGTVVGTGWAGMTALVTPGNWDSTAGNDVIARAADGRLWLSPGNNQRSFSRHHLLGIGWQGVTYIG